MARAHRQPSKSRRGASPSRPCLLAWLITRRCCCRVETTIPRESARAFSQTRRWLTATRQKRMIVWRSRRVVRNRRGGSAPARRQAAAALCDEAGLIRAWASCRRRRRGACRARRSQIERSACCAAAVCSARRGATARAVRRCRRAGPATARRPPRRRRDRNGKARSDRDRADAALIAASVGAPAAARRAPVVVSSVTRTARGATVCSRRRAPSSAKHARDAAPRRWRLSSVQAHSG